MRPALLLIASVTLAACQRHESAVTGVPATTDAPPRRISGPMRPLSAELRDDPALLEKAAAYGRENPEAGLRWLFDLGAISDQDMILDAYLGQALKSNPRHTLDLADLLEAPETRRAYQWAAYDRIAERNSPLAWRLWGERHTTHDDEPALSILRIETRTSGLRQAWEHLLAQDPGATVTESGACTLFATANFHGDDALFALKLLRQIPEGDLPNLEPAMIDSLVRSAPDDFGAWIVSLPRNPRLDPAYVALARREASRHDFTNSRAWLDRIHDPVMREQTTAYERDEMSSTPLAVSPAGR